MKHAIVDIDGCLCESIFKNLGHNDNDKLKNKEFEEKLAGVKPYDWAVKHDWSKYKKISVVTGRLETHNHVTGTWLTKLFGRDFELYNTEWNDKLPTRKDSYDDYVRRKSIKIFDEMVRMFNDKTDKFDIFEDDKNVLKELEDQEWFEVDYYHVIEGKIK